MMRKGTAYQIYKSLPPAEQHDFRRWARGNAMLFTMVAGAAVAVLALAHRDQSLPKVATQSLEPAGYSAPSRVAAQPAVHQQQR